MDRSQLFATDKELFDLIFSSRQRLTERVLRDLATEKRIFCSAKASRSALADYLSGLPHDWEGIENLLRHSESGTRGERATSTVIKSPIAMDEVRAVLREYSDDARGMDRMTMPPAGAKVINANLEYSEFDLSRTRLLQRQQKSAAFEVRFDDDEITIRYPATEKGREVVSDLIDRLERRQKCTLPKDEITISDLSIANRSQFFLELLSKMDGYNTETVTRLRVSVAPEPTGLGEPDDDLVDDASDELLHLVEQVALKGENLLASPEYRQLRDSGFFITSLTWVAIQTKQPFDRVQFDASFEDGRSGTGFRYIARFARRSKSDRYPQNFKVPPDPMKKLFMGSIEETARKTLASLRSSSTDGETS